MKKIIRIIVLGILLYVGYNALILSHKSSGTVAKGNIELRNKDDSLSFAVSMIIAEDMPFKMVEIGIDSTTIDDFVRGMRSVFPLDETPESRAYYNGVLAAIEAAEMLDRANEAIYPDENDKKVNRQLFLEGLVATATADTSVMTSDVAADYYNHIVFRSRSEKFMADNKKRQGVVTLPSGLQYKIEKSGNGTTATYNGSATCIYKGTYPNGVIFTSSKGEAVELETRTLVPGFAEALMTLPAGTRCKVYIPWELAYGAKGANNIPPYSALVYDLEILSAK